jgi:ketosteroid isomerase-like protein
MEKRETMLELIRRAYAARGKGDLDGLMMAFHPEAVFTLVGDREAVDAAGSIHGQGALREALGGFIANFQFVERRILSELVEGDRAAVHSRLVVRYNPTNTTRTTDCLDLLRFQDGKIVELIEFADTALISDMMSGALQGSGIR